MLTMSAHRAFSRSWRLLWSALRRSFAGKHATGDGDVLATGLLGHIHSLRQGTSLTHLRQLDQHGKINSASTSTFGRLMQEIARLHGVPPNMSVRMATPSPLSTRFTASVIALRRKSGSSLAPIVMASICSWPPMICSSAALNSWARRPWVTSTRPIIGNPVLSDVERRLWGHDDRAVRIEALKARGQQRRTKWYTSCNVQRRPKTFN